MKIDKSITHIFFAVLLMLFIITGLPGTSLSVDNATGKEVKQEQAKEQKNPYVNADITTKIMPSANNTFGYDILLYEKPLVHQPTIPGLPGNDTSYSV